ncbi:Sorting nexin, cytoplasm-to-vacuole targeting pathway/endosomal sorting [Lunasporangiospora selenospora]|uniref:Sorting nexin, cytoplasm-to-vacuole targeting pathway/endosomal sorting n=1 Tax=Lunasporangiospora selenospora TaxID=979761 RepID=A0A9P6G258_9FUNG|nr:Sorting nexin, cytoplasm-to-vacuole targeting pathway/endosomal sorting [Lunasporangiospora selenospora]
MSHYRSDDAPEEVEHHQPHSIPQSVPYMAYTTIPRDAPGTRCCSISTLLLQPTTILVTNHSKVPDGLSASSFVAYTIKTGNTEVRRRYSEFESLRKLLCRVYPTLIVPPIPEKHTISNYANLQNKSKEEAAIVEKRKRLLQKFLNRLAVHEILSHEHIFHRFLETDVSWTELLHGPPVSTLPKNTLSASLSLITPLSEDGSTPELPLPSPGPSQGLSAMTLPEPQQDPRFIDSEVFTQKFSNQLSGSMDRSQKRVVRRLGDIANDNTELGATLNAFSLNINGDEPLVNAVETVGRAADSSIYATSDLIKSLDISVNEPLQEYVQYANIIKSILKFRHQKYMQSATTADQLEGKRSSLDNLERMESEAKRIENALNRERTGSVSAVSPTGSSREDAHQDDSPATPTSAREGGGGFSDEPESFASGIDPSSTDPHRPHSDESSDPNVSDTAAAEHGQQNPYAQMHSQQPSVKRRSTRLNVFSALSHTIHGIIDVDPEATRRNNIGKTRDAIGQLEVQLTTTNADLDKISQAIQSDLDRFQRQKIMDIREILLAYAKAHQKWCQKNLESWQKAKASVESIPV